MIPGAVALAVLGWALTFGTEWGNFWLKIGGTILCLTAYALAFGRPVLRWNFRSVLLGIASAAVLYAIFWAGDRLAPYVVPGARAQVGGIYGLGEDAPRIRIFLLLFFITGPGEEIFWRGFLQEKLQARWGILRGWLAAVGIYGAAHVFSGNPMLVAASLVAGLFWGGLYAWKKDLTALIVSHSVWSAVIFTVFPIR